MRKLRVTSGLKQETSFIVITLNPESNCTCRLKNHSLFHWNILSLPELPTRNWMWCRSNILKITGTLMEKEKCRMHGQVSRDSWYWMRSHLMEIHGPEGDWRGNKRPQDLTMYGQMWWSICMMHGSAKRNKSERSKNQLHNARSLRSIFFIELGDEEFNRIMEKMLVESWKFRCNAF